jgi:16S rRNA processing protein RimM
LKKDEWYIADLLNCSLIYEGKDDPATLNAPTVVGTITDVLEGGGGYLLEVSLSESCDRKVLVPFNKQFIGKVDIKNKTVQLMHLWILE